MVLECVNFGPILVPVEHSNSIVIRTRQNVRQGGVNDNVPNVISVFLDCFNFFCSVIIVNANFVVICSNNNPLLSHNKFSTANRRISYFDLFDLGLCVVVEDQNVACIKCY